MSFCVPCSVFLLSATSCLQECTESAFQLYMVCHYALVGPPAKIFLVRPPLIFLGGLHILFNCIWKPMVFVCSHLLFSIYSASVCCCFPSVHGLLVNFSQPRLKTEQPSTACTNTSSCELMGYNFYWFLPITYSSVHHHFSLICPFARQAVRWGPFIRKAIRVMTYE